MNIAPEEVAANNRRDLMLAAERRWAWRSLAGVSLAVVTFAPLIGKYLLFLIYLQPIDQSCNWWRWMHWAPFWFIVLGLLSGPLVWLAAIECEHRLRWLRRCRLPLAAALSVAAAIVGGAVLDHPRGRWFFAEWAKVRTENPSYARNVLNWQAGLFPQAGGSPQSALRIGVVGSSQINWAVDHELLASQLAKSRVEKNCLAGFGPMNYLTLAERIRDRGHTHVVCWLSEFDMFRETDVPADRLRWCVTPVSWGRIWNLLSAQQNWLNRSQLADLAVASCLPLWRNREHCRRGVLGYWWDISRPVDGTPHVGVPVLARTADADTARANIRRNITRTPLVDVNFACFEQFANTLRQRGVTLLVVEGSSHPDVMASYDSTYRGETRRRLTRMAETAGFLYLSAEQLPHFRAEDFVDPYHLGPAGRTRFTRFLADYLADADN